MIPDVMIFQASKSSRIDQILMNGNGSMAISPVKLYNLLGDNPSIECQSQIKCHDKFNVTWSQCYKLLCFRN